MAMVTGHDAAHAHMRARRREIHSVWYMLATLVVALGSAVGATTATRWLLAGMPRVPRPAPQATAPLPVWHDALPAAGDPLAVGLGATQSYAGLTITVDALRLATAPGSVGAPPGNQFAIVTVTLANTDPVMALPYNAADFWLAEAGGAAHHEVFAALASPLGTGQIAAHTQIAGDIAFLVTATPDPTTTPDPQIVFAPPDGRGITLRWDVPLTPALP